MKVAPGKPKLRGSWPPDPPVRREAPAHVGETGGGEGERPPGKGGTLVCDATIWFPCALRD